MSLSVVVAAKNEEAIIGRCLDSIKGIADEIIIIDNMSIDNTAKICKQYTKKVFKEKGDTLNLIPYLHNKGIEKATKDWVLILDADVIVPERAAREIKQRIGDARYNGFFLTHRTFCLGKLMKSYAWNHRILKLFRRGTAVFPCDAAHCVLPVPGRIGAIRSPLIHYAHPSLEVVARKCLHYAIQDGTKMARGEGGGFLNKRMSRVRFYHFFTDPLWVFALFYVYRGGFVDGVHGLVMAILMAYYVFLERVRMFEVQYA